MPENHQNRGPKENRRGCRGRSPRQALGVPPKNISGGRVGISTPGGGEPSNKQEEERDMAKMYYESDADLSLISDKKIGVMGYGSQGHAHALNMKDNGLDVMVGLYEGSKSWSKVEEDGLAVGLVDEVARESDIIMVLIPDTSQAEVYRKAILPHMLPNKTLMFAHGFNIHYKTIVPPDTVDVSMVAPKAPGHRMREVFTKGSGVPGLLAIHQDVSGHAKEIGLAYARGVGCTRAGVLETTFKEETETDLFGEQTVLCGGRDGSDKGRVRDDGRGGLSARVGLLRMPTRAQAHCRPALSRRHGVHALLSQRNR